MSRFRVILEDSVAFSYKAVCSGLPEYRNALIFRNFGMETEHVKVIKDRVKKVSAGAGVTDGGFGPLSIDLR